MSLGPGMIAPLREPLHGASCERRGWPWQAPKQVAAAPGSARDAWPKISVVTPSFNQCGFLEQAMRSVLQQGYPHLEYLVLDGGSTDQCVQVIEHYGACLQYWRSGADAGQAAAIAEGFERASGDICCWLNSDDLLLPGALWHVASLFRQRPATRFMYGNRLTIDAAGKVIDRHLWPRFLSSYHWAQGQPMAQECCFWTRELYEQVGGLDRNRFFTMDHDLFYRMWRVTKMHKTPAVLGCLRIHEQSKNALHQDVRERELADTRAAFGLRVPGPVMARVINRLDRMQIAWEARALAPVPAGQDIGDVAMRMHRQ